MKLLTPEEVRDMTGAKVHTLANWRSQGRGPRWIKPHGRSILYPLEWVQEWLMSTQGGTNGTEKTQRQVALPVRAGRPPVRTQHRLGRHQTQRERGDARGGGAPAGDQGGPGVPTAPEGPDVQ